MQPEFGLWREKHNELFLNQYKNPMGVLHFHSPIELYYVDEGELEVWINDQHTVMKPGEISVALSYDSHCYHYVGETTASLLIIPTFMCKEFLAEIKNKRATNSIIRDAEASRKIKECYDEIKKDSSNRIKTLGFINIILGIVMEQISFEPINSTIETRLSSQLLFYISENYKDDISLNSIAQEFGYNPSYLSRYFKSCFNVGVNQYITRVRLRDAVKLMQTSENNITYCAFESGFNSIRTFYRAFLKEYGCTPKEYSEQIGRQ